MEEQSEWIKVHAAEFLLWENEATAEVREVFIEQNRLFGDQSPYRIGIWRVLAQAANDGDERLHWINKVAAVYADWEAPDRLHAIETLAKLRYPVISVDSLNKVAGSLMNAFSLYQLWNLAYQPSIDRVNIIESLVSCIEQSVTVLQHRPNVLVASFVLRYLGPLQSGIWQRLAAITQSAELETSLYANLLATLWITQPPSDSENERIHRLLTRLADDSVGINQVLLAFASHGSAEQWNNIRAWYDRLRDKTSSGYNADIHASAAYAILSFTTSNEE